MAGLFSSDEQDMLGTIMQQRNQSNQALGSGYGKYGGIVQAGAGMADIGGDAMFGGATGASDPRMIEQQEVKAIFSKASTQTGNSTSPAFYTALSELLAAKFPEQSKKAAEEGNRLNKLALENKKLMLENTRIDEENKKVAQDAKNATTVVANRLAALTVKFPGMLEEERKAIADSPEAFNAMVKPIPVTKTDFQKTIGHLPIAEQNKLLNQYAALQLDPDPTGQKALAIETGRATAAAVARGVEDARVLKSNTMEDKALQLAYASEDMQGPLDLLNEVMASAPTDAKGRAMQFAFEKLAITDQAALKDQVVTLNSAKVINLLMRLKSQSQTGATGFGAISAPELTLLMADIRVLKPESKDFVKNLQAVKDKWISIQQRLGAERMKIIDRKKVFDGGGKSSQGTSSGGSGSGNNEVDFGSME